MAAGLGWTCSQVRVRYSSISKSQSPFCQICLRMKISNNLAATVKPRRPQRSARPGRKLPEGLRASAAKENCASTAPALWRDKPDPLTLHQAKSSLSPITPEQFALVDTVIAEHKGVPGSLITVLRLCQDIVGYFPPGLITHIADGMNLPVSKVYGVISFYSLFSLKPKGRHKIRVCTGTACYVRGVREVLDRVERRFDVKAGGTCESGRFSLEPVRCLGACGLAPVMVVDRDTHGGVTPDSACEILEGYE